MKPRIRIRLDTLYVKKDGRFWGKAKWVLNAKVDAATLGDPAERFVVTDGQTVTFAAPRWSQSVEIDAATSVVVSFHAEEVGSWFNDDFGSVTHTLKWPFPQQTLTKENKYYKVSFAVEHEILGVFKRHDPDAVFACRGTAGNPECNTVSGPVKKVRFEACEVRPLPPAAYMPARIGGGVVGTVLFNSGTGVSITELDSLNVLGNPAVIPILTAAEATGDTAAKIHLTYYEPASLMLDPGDARVQWRITSLDGKGQAAFVGSNQGLLVKCRGTAEGEVQLTVSFLGTDVAIYRALVKPLRKILCRVNLAKGGAGFETTSSAADAKKHIYVANIILRQAGVQLELEANDTVTSGAVKKDTGIFELPLGKKTKGRARNVGKLPPIALMNFRKKVLNLVYVVSMTDASVLGQAVMMPFNSSPKPVGGSFPQLTDSGTPSTSWINPSGIFPQGAATPQILEMMQQQLHPKNKQCWAVTICNGNTTMLQVANTMAHEVGHALGLAHREATQDLLPELNENLMHATEGPVKAQDLDIAQAKAIHVSPLVT